MHLDVANETIQNNNNKVVNFFMTLYEYCVVSYIINQNVHLKIKDFPRRIYLELEDKTQSVHAVKTVFDHFK